MDTIKENLKEIKALNSKNQLFHDSLSSEKEHKKIKKVFGILQRKI